MTNSPPREAPIVAFGITVNGEPRQVAVDVRTTLLDLLTSRSALMHHLRKEVYAAPERVDAALLDHLYALHRDTFLRHGHEPYLTRAFFGEIARTLPQSLMVKLAVYQRAIVAVAIFFVSPEALFGRYWGGAADYHSLHFEACYHQGIEFCIERGIARFEPGTQGEHKVSRGFEPQLTWSAHFIADRQFRAAIAQYLEREGAAVESYALEVQEHVPYRRRRGLGERA